MFGDSDARRDDLGSGEPPQVAAEVDPMDSATDTSTDESGDLDGALDDWDDEPDESDDVSDADVTDDVTDDDGPSDLADDDADESQDDASDRRNGDEDVEDDGAAAEVPYAPLDATPDVPTPPVTGDQAVDEAMMRLAVSQAGSFAARIESGEHAHRSLQSRLGGLGGA
jgi:hypothetical protein